MTIREKKLLKLLEEILDHQIANRGTESAFYICYTYGIENGKRQFPEWVKKAEKELKQ